ncbi:MAG: hypothetical protein KF802_15780 [Bdellovibrionaceae bacterium]|nr:hypothetical protein [Pseudobdellovibrionaceae bacterium]MBX3034919.1 hypothetical protein [Pseudobdellovibrionaceae bacterium]
MKWSLLVVILAFTLPARAWQYALETAPLLAPSFLDLHEISQRFSPHGYESVTDLRLAPAGLPFDRLFVNHDWSKSFSLKAGLALPPSWEGRILEDKDLGLSVFHFRHRDVAYVLVALGLSRPELKQILRPWLRAPAGSAAAIRSRLLLPAAEAAEACEGPRVGPTRSLASVASHIEEESILRQIGRCGADAWSGIKSSAGATLDFFKKLATNPKALWQETKESMLALKNFVTNIHEELKGAWAHLQGLSAEEKTKIACTLSGSLVMEGAQAALGGVGLAKTLPALTLKLRSTVAMLKNLGQLEKSGLRIPNKAQWTDEVIRCAL